LWPSSLDHHRRRVMEHAEAVQRVDVNDAVDPPPGPDADNAGAQRP
jgi:hypothetical protein